MSPQTGGLAAPLPREGAPDSLGAALREARDA
jgi:hypothetical protein